MSAGAVSAIDLAVPRTAAPGVVRLLWLLTAVGIATFAVLLATDRQRLWTDYLAEYLFFTGLAQAGVVWSAVTRGCNARWARPLQRMAEATAAALPLSVLLFVPLMLARRTVYANWWTHPPPRKLPWLAHGFLLGRDLGILAALALLGLLWLRRSLRPGQPGLNRLWVVMIFAFCYGYTVLGWDLNLALDAGWYDYLYGWYFFITHWYAGLAMVTLLALAWRNRLRAHGLITRDILHDNAELTFGFAIFWAYLFWSQFMVLWYANRQDDIVILHRLSAMRPWVTLSWITLTLGFFLPFAFGLSRAFKRRPRTLAVLAGFTLAGMWLEQNLMVDVSLWRRGLPPLATSALLGCGFAGLYGLAYLALLRRIPLFPTTDAWLREALLVHPARH